MIPYLLLIFIPFLFNFVSIKQYNKRQLCIGKGQSITQNSMALPVFFIILILILALRHETIGRDVIAYKSYFFRWSENSLSDFFPIQLESLFKVYNWVIGQVSVDYQVYLAITSLVTVLPIALLYCEDRRNGYLKIILFVNMATFVMLFSGLRQAIAMAIGMIAYRFVRKKKLFPFLLLGLLALGVHHSAFMLFLMYPIYHMTIKKKHLIIIIPVIVTVYIFKRQFFSFIVNILALISDKYTDAEISTTGAVTMLILFAIFAVFSYVIPDERMVDKEIVGLRNLLLLALVMQCFAPLHSLAMRLNYYYILFIPILISKVLTVYKPVFRQVAVVGNYVMCIFFTMYYVMNTYLSYVTGISTLDTIPYLPFWEG